MVRKVTRRKLLDAAAIAVSISTIATVASRSSDERDDEQSASSGNSAHQRGESEDEVSYPLTIDDFDGVIREAWGNADNHETTDTVARVGSHSAYRAEGNPLYDDGTRFKDAFRENGRFIGWFIYVDEMSEHASFSLGFNGDNPPVANNFSELFVDAYNGEVIFRERIGDEINVIETTDASLFSNQWYEVIAWWGQGIVECWVYDGDDEIGHLQSVDYLHHGDHWWLSDGKTGDDSVIDSVRFYEEHPHTGRHYAEQSETESHELFVSPDGSDDDGDGSYGNPWASVSHAVEVVNNLPNSAGKTLNILDGTYNESSDEQIVLTATGTESEPFKLVGHGNPTVNFSQVMLEDSWTAAFRLENSHHVAVEGITFEESRGFGFRVGENVSKITIEDCVSRNNGNTGFYSRPIGADEWDVVYERCESHGNYHGDSHADGFALGRQTSYRSVVYVDCVAHHNEDDGYDWHFGNGNIAIGCIAHSNGFDEQTGEHIGSGWGFKTGTSDPDRVLGPVYLYNCIAYHNASWGFADNANPHPNEWYNCTAYENSLETDNDYSNFQLWGTGETEIRNCISVNSNGEHIGKSERHNDRYNTWNDGIEIVDPQFQSEDPDNELFLHLSGDSPCIDAGVEVGLDYSGDAPDLGAYEYGLDTEPIQ